MDIIILTCSVSLILFLYKLFLQSFTIPLYTMTVQLSMAMGHHTLTYHYSKATKSHKQLTLILCNVTLDTKLNCSLLSLQLLFLYKLFI